MKNDGVFITPLVSENNTTITGVLIGELINGKIKCRYGLLNDYHQMGEFKKEFVLGMIQLENHVFGCTSFRIYDHSLFGSAKVIYLRKGQQQQAQIANTQDDPCELIEIWHDPTEEACHCSGDEFFTGRYMYSGDCFGTPDYYIFLPHPAGLSDLMALLH